MIGDIVMSFVLSVCGVGFSLIVGDKRMSRISTKEVVDDNVQKVFQINSNVSIGFTGDPISIKIVLDELNCYNKDVLTMEKINKIISQRLSEITTNELGIKLIITGKNRKNNFVIYVIDSKNNYSPSLYEPTNDRFAIAYAGSEAIFSTNIIEKFYEQLRECKTVEQIRDCMIGCVQNVSDVDNTVNKLIDGVMLT